MTPLQEEHQKCIDTIMASTTKLAKNIKETIPGIIIRARHPKLPDIVTGQLLFNGNLSGQDHMFRAAGSAAKSFGKTGATPVSYSAMAYGKKAMDDGTFGPPVLCVSTFDAVGEERHNSIVDVTVSKDGTIESYGKQEDNSPSEMASLLEMFLSCFVLDACGLLPSDIDDKVGVHYVKNEFPK